MAIYLLSLAEMTGIYLQDQIEAKNAARIYQPLPNGVLAKRKGDVADDAVDNRLVDYSPKPRPVIAGQDLLPGQADFNPAFDVIGVRLYRSVPDDLAGVVPGLKQAGHDDGLEIADG